MNENKQQKILWAIGVVLILGGVIYYRFIA